MKKLVFLAFMALATVLSAQKADYYEGNLEFKGQKLPLTLEVSIGKEILTFSYFSYFVLLISEIIIAVAIEALRLSGLLSVRKRGIVIF